VSFRPAVGAGAGRLELLGSDRPRLLVAVLTIARQKATFRAGQLSVTPTPPKAKSPQKM
jgi:hypothetical protein